VLPKWTPHIQTCLHEQKMGKSVPGGKNASLSSSSLSHPVDCKILSFDHRRAGPSLRRTRSGFHRASPDRCKPNSPRDLYARGALVGGGDGQAGLASGNHARPRARPPAASSSRARSGVASGTVRGGSDQARSGAAVVSSNSSRR
jgi:hypothetical protein